MKPELYDTHCHLDFAEFDDCRDFVLEACQQANITKVLIPSVQSVSWGRVQDLAKKKAQLFYALGLHPLFIKSHTLTDLEALCERARMRPEGLVAIGEIGLDATAPDMPFQQVLFDAQLTLAEAMSLPVIMHARRTHAQILSSLKKVSVSGVIHAFSGSVELLNQYVSKGIAIGVGCVITWPSAEPTRAAIRQAPLGSLVLETDSPDMRVSSRERSEVGSPLDICQVFSALCDVRPEPPEILAQALKKNADRVFFDR